MMRTIVGPGLMAITSYQVFGQSAATRPEFEAASVKSNKSGDRAPWRFVGSRGGITATNVTLQFLIMNAYGVRDNQISGGPSWLNFERYDVVAKDQSDNPIPAKRSQMLQALLADRFQLRLRRETKELPVYALVVGKNGPKFHEADTGNQEGNKTGRGRITAHNISMELFAKRLEGQLGRTVIDGTGLKGHYAFELEWTPEPLEPPVTLSGHVPGPSPTSADTTGPSIFTALQEQLGLKLEPRKGPVEILIIDHVEKPSEN